MIESEAVPDQAELHREAQVRLRRRRRLLIGVVGLPTVALPLALVALSGREITGRMILILLIPLAVGCLVLLALLPLVRRQNRNPPLLLGADRPTRRAVGRALRTGVAPDARVDALARDSARQTLRLTWLLWLAVGMTLLQAALAASRLIDGDGPGEVALGIVTAALLAASAVAQAVSRRRSRRYLARGRTAALEDPSLG